MARPTATNSPKETKLKELTVDQQLVAINEEIQRFIALFKQKGDLTYEEINETLPLEFVSSAALDLFMQSLDANGVKITEPSTQKGTSGQAEGFLLDESQQAEEEEEVEEEADDIRGNDPVRLYLRKMGSVSLLTREGEVEIARRIEMGEREIVRAILLSPVGTLEIIQLGQRLDAGRIKIKSIFRGLEDEETKYDEKEYIEKIHELIGHVKGYQASVDKWFKMLRSETTSEPDPDSLIANEPINSPEHNLGRYFVFIYSTIPLLVFFKKNINKFRNFDKSN
jgi:RNA polymerase primary sigma factor